ncbi:hypothetical protein [Paraburkholderia saeva]|uniref:DUF4276 family protein n=1 Tax=Paraburkholderia saeva TaxID=2777537 RepID=A0A9N8RR88_9BURK|nr:hypothetical protein [Paraburkholderia saeva]CAG4886007.1 hypothetical protein LMG31841_00106 [Paraburkholderia saeva]CAG4887529.1 hypothetical protein R70241_00454 [Paraburkholderia saeva]CAG4915718.1 hypothetical protein R52603_04369 [Paraburkholderia saeva]
MRLIRYTLLADGRSDSSLLPIIQWVVEENFQDFATQSAFALDGIPPPSEGLRRRVDAAIALYNCDLLFVHRDAEREPYAVRRRELDEALVGLGTSWVPVIPVRMTEAWLLGDEEAIRRAAENPRGRVPLPLPVNARCEGLPDPKETLFGLLRTAADRPARRPIDERRCRARVAELTSSFAHLRDLDSFRRFERDVVHALNLI